jgi:hypothetical protein
MKTLEEKNRMIAKFMGFEDESRFIGGHNVMRRKTIWKFGCQQYESYNYDDLKYHISWDWLMPVVEKIESFEGTHGNNYKFTIQNETSYIDCTNIISSPSVKSKIESTYQVVVEFIEWYNEQK